MGQVNLPKPARGMDIEQLINLINMLIDELQHLLTGHLDVKNIRAQSITADRMNVEQLSAIAADLGHITAGLIEAVEIYGSYIATANAGVYPRIEFSSTSKILKAETASTKYLQVEALGGSGSAGIRLVDNLLDAFFQAAAGQLFIGTISGSGSVTIGSGNHLFLRAAAGHYVEFDSWGEIYSSGEGQTLATALSNLSSSISSLSSSVSSHSSTLSNHESRISALESP